MERINEKVGAWLLQGHTRTELAELLGMSRQTLSNRLDGTAMWNWDEVLKLADLLGVTPNEMAGITE